jgi:hypothetical protein
VGKRELSSGEYRLLRAPLQTKIVTNGFCRAELISQTVESCPASKIVASGYSQGALVLHNAASRLPAETMNALSSIVLFGDPSKFHYFPRPSLY